MPTLDPNEAIDLDEAIERVLRSGSGHDEHDRSEGG